MGCSDSERLAVVLSARPASGSDKVRPCSTGPGCTELGNVWSTQASSDRSSPARADGLRAINGKGKRDYGILLLLARLGLRAGEIVALQLDDINWANAELAVRSKKGDGWARLPLPADVDRALARYLMVRPPSSYRNVFVRGYAPYTPFVASGPASVLVRNAIERAGVKSARTGAHVFRHSPATEMLRRGASLTEMGRVLRHWDPDSTAIYAKVDLGALREPALAWPGGAR